MGKSTESRLLSFFLRHETLLSKEALGECCAKIGRRGKSEEGYGVRRSAEVGGWELPLEPSFSSALPTGTCFNVSSGSRGRNRLRDQVLEDSLRSKLVGCNRIAAPNFSVSKNLPI